MSNELTEEQKNGIGCLSMLLAVPIDWFVMIYVAGFSLMKLWLWFIVPIGVREINVYQAAGIYLFFAVLFAKFEDNSDNETNVFVRVWQRIVFKFISISFLLLTGFVIHKFLMPH